MRLCMYGYPLKDETVGFCTESAEENHIVSRTVCDDLVLSRCTSYRVAGRCCSVTTTFSRLRGRCEGYGDDVIIQLITSPTQYTT